MTHNIDNKWYVINTMVGHENKVARLILDEVNKRQVHDMVSDVIVPSESVAEIRRGKRVNTEKKICPGYVLVRMTLNDTVWDIVRGIAGINKFLGSANKPSEVPDHEIQKILNRVSESKATVLEEIEIYEVGSMVKIIDGAFSGFCAVIENVDNERKELKVLVSIFGRETPVELRFDQVERIKSKN